MGAATAWHACAVLAVLLLSVHTVAGVEETVLHDSFEPNLDPTMWSTVVGGAPSAGCGFLTAPNAYRFAGTVQRQIATKPIDCSRGGAIQFALRYGVVAGSECDSPAPGDDVELQFSLDLGVTWIDWRVMQVRVDEEFDDWGLVTYEIDPRAYSERTMFRWIQLVFDTTVDNWALDEVTIKVNVDEKFECVQPVDGLFSFCDLTTYNIQSTVQWDVEDQYAELFWNNIKDSIPTKTACQRRMKAQACAMFVPACTNTSSVETGRTKPCRSMCIDSFEYCSKNLDEDLIQSVCSKSSLFADEPDCTVYPNDDIHRVPWWLKVMLCYLFAFSCMIYCGVKWKPWWREQKKRFFTRTKKRKGKSAS